MEGLWPATRALAAAFTIQLCLGAAAPSITTITPLDVRHAQIDAGEGGRPCLDGSHADTVRQMKMLLGRWEKQGKRNHDHEYAAFLRERDGLLSRVVSAGSAEEGMHCAICLEKTNAQESTANISLIDGCLHPFCLDCILSWASYPARTASHRAASGRNRNTIASNRRSRSCPSRGAVLDGMRDGVLRSEQDTMHTHSGCPLCKQPILQLFVQVESDGEDLQASAWRREVHPCALLH